MSEKVEFKGISIDIQELNELRELTVYLEGFIDSLNSPPILAYLTEKLRDRNGLKIITLNFQKLTYISSTGIGVLTSLLMDCKKRNIDLKLSDVNGKILDVITLLGFSAFFTIENSHD